MTAPDHGDLYFGIDARHIRQLGQQLVGDRITALSELIKNSYDADATSVVVDFNQQTGDGPSRIFLGDDGTGMSLETLQSSWMRISGDGKERDPVSPVFGRTRAGRKGIGRFSAESLGRNLVLQTTRRGEPSAVEAYFDWEHAYSSGEDLTEVPNPWRRIPSDPAMHGTTLIIQGLHDVWTQTQRERVARSIQLLQPPFPIVGSAVGRVDPGFHVEMRVDGVTQPTRSGLQEFLDGATARITGGVDRDGRAWMKVESSRLKLNEVRTIDRPASSCGPFDVEAAYFIYRSDAIGVPVRAAQEMAKRFGGMRIYRDGLRLLPYGEQSDDWLGLNELYRSRSRTLAPVGRENYFGQVTIGREANPALLDTASREGLLRNRAFEEMHGIVFEILVQAAITVAASRATSKRQAPTRPSSRREILQEATNTVVSAAREKFSGDAARAVIDIVEAALETTATAATSADQDEAAERSALLEELELLRILASLGTSVNVFSHEVRSTVNASSTALAILAREVPDAQLEAAREANRRLSDLAGYIDRYSSASQRRTREAQAMFNVLTDFRTRFAQTLAAQVSTKLDISPRGLRTAPMGRTAIEAILINLFTNAVKAMDREGLTQREVLISARGEGAWVVLRMEDTGTGVPAEVRDKIFGAFVTTSSAAESELGVGTGLGLKIVSDLVEEYGGSVGLAEPSEGYATAFEVRLPRLSTQVSEPQ